MTPSKKFIQLRREKISSNENNKWNPIGEH